MRSKPNILVTGTPGTGKTTTSAAVAEATTLRHINIGDLVRDKKLHDGWDDQLECYVINEDLVCDELEEMMEEGGNIVDHHGCDFFPERWFDRVVVLQTENSVLYDRLSKRYPEETVVAMKSDSIDDMNRNVATITEWVRSWRPAA
ncbi:hypothetical protein Ccrd_014163 [Cynara cardunculus var. scolymus]|uniref:Adenylate kinase n=1 Tax=Cynara cardunculus var. scolymus TaxID=59895 RepID=A0A103YE81_CYNCS|nr:hypothetical protein Ccrd_014163 [Cynara cardunculus var. scolymus]